MGVQPLCLYVWYRLSLQSGWLKYRTHTAWKAAQVTGGLVLRRAVFPLPNRNEIAYVLGAVGRQRLLAEADEIVAGVCRIFGGQPVPLPGEGGGQKHWTVYEGGDWTEITSRLPHADVKYVWEAARFGWAFTLARAYFVSRDERYAQAFWEHTCRFLDANPAYQGAHWTSAQEVALRLMAFVFAWQVFADSAHSTDARAQRLAQAVAQHAERLPVSLAYARSQNNNHLLSEATGLYTAALALPQHPRSAHWRRLGWRWLNAALQRQIDRDGAYIQHSANYHRLMLQEALWINLLNCACGQEMPAQSASRLAAATRWLFHLLDPASGGVPNLGPNDGARVLPLSVCAFADYRPTLQAAGRAFLGEALVAPGAWDEMSLWMGVGAAGQALPQGEEIVQKPQQTPHTLHVDEQHTWAYLRCARFTARPGHADQNHLDLWWRGLNLAQDAGTYLYNAASPWNNALTSALVHNTVTVNGCDQMSRAGRFLYLDWAQGSLLERAEKDGVWTSLTCQHDGYQRLGVFHRRKVTLYHAGICEVQDDLLPAALSSAGKEIDCRLHWLLPDWNWQAHENEDGFVCQLESPHGWVALSLRAAGVEKARLRLLRGGEEVYTSAGAPSSEDPSPEDPSSEDPSPEDPSPSDVIFGWVSPAYGEKHAALSVVLQGTGRLPCGFITIWYLPGFGK